MSRPRSQNDTAGLGLAAVWAGSAPVLDSMVHHLLDRRSVEDNGATRGLLLVGLQGGALGVEVRDGVLGNLIDADAALGGQGL